MHPQTAFSAASAGALMLIDPGTYHLTDSDADSWSWIINKNINVRGLGSNCNDTVLVQDSASGLIRLAVDVCANTLLENIRISYNLAYDWVAPLGLMNSSTALTVSKCNITTGWKTSQYHFVCWWTNLTTGFVKFRQTLFSRSNAAPFANLSGNSPYLNLGRVYLDKVERVNEGSLLSPFVTGTLAQSDYRSAPTVGYGPNYGDYLITEDSGRSIAAKEMHYRRLRNAS